MTPDERSLRVSDTTLLRCSGGGIVVGKLYIRVRRKPWPVYAGWRSASTLIYAAEKVLSLALLRHPDSRPCVTGGGVVPLNKRRVIHHEGRGPSRVVSKDGTTPPILIGLS